MNNVLRALELSSEKPVLTTAEPGFIMIFAVYWKTRIFTEIEPYKISRRSFKIKNRKIPCHGKALTYKNE